MYLVKDIDKIRKLTLKQHKGISDKKAEKIEKIDTFMVDTRCTVKTHKGYILGLP
jgi:adenylate kinase